MTKVSVRSERSLPEPERGSFPAVTQKSVQDDYVVYFSDDPGATVSEILNYLKTGDDKLIDLRVERPSLEERFLEITAARPTMTAFIPFANHFTFEFRSGLRNRACSCSTISSRSASTPSWVWS